MKKEAIILGSNNEGFKESGRILGKFLIFCLIASICITIGYYTSYFLGFVIFCFIYGVGFFIRKKMRAKKK
ncbi:MAG: hypothetical protein NTU63_01930 [Candidatus Pacearchaeota archaeon]|nr:hypothetical protein [Candidatus Pacearchaeota archaeon]